MTWHFQNLSHGFQNLKQRDVSERSSWRKELGGLWYVVHESAQRAGSPKFPIWPGFLGARYLVNKKYSTTHQRLDVQVWVALEVFWIDKKQPKRIWWTLGSDLNDHQFLCDRVTLGFTEVHWRRLGPKPKGVLISQKETNSCLLDVFILKMLSNFASFLCFLRIFEIPILWW